MASGFSALAAALVVGARKDYGRQALLPHNAVYVLLGAGILWFGWFGFNGGSGFGTGDASVLAFTNTLLCPAATLVVWIVLDLIRGRKVTAIGAATAIIVGCVLITPAGGFISPGWAMALGALGALPCYAAIVWRPRTRVDETLDVLAAHGIAGFIGILFIGFFAQATWNGVSDGLLYGNSDQLVDQAKAALATPVYAFGVTYVLLRLIGLVMPLRGPEREEALGMDVDLPRRGGLPHRRGRDPGHARRPARRRRAGRPALVPDPAPPGRAYGPLSTPGRGVEAVGAASTQSSGARSPKTSATWTSYRAATTRSHPPPGFGHGLPVPL